MIRPVVPLSERERHVVDYCFAGLDADRIARFLGCSERAVAAIMRAAGDKIGGPSWAPPRMRCIIFAAMEIGVLEFLAGWRDEDGRILEPPPHLSDAAKTVVVQVPEPELPLTK